MPRDLRSLWSWPVILAVCGLLAVIGVGVAWVMRGDIKPAPTGDQSGLLAVDGLRAGGWVEASSSTVTRASESGSSLAFSSPRTAECAPFREFETHLADLDAAFTSGGSRVIERRNGDQLLATAAHTVATFGDEMVVDQAITELKSIFASPQFLDCLRSAAELDGSTPVVELANMTVAVPESGAGIAVRYRTAPAEQGGEMVQHILWWKSGKTLSALVVSVWDAGVGVGDVVEAARAAVQHERGR